MRNVKSPTRFPIPVARPAPVAMALALLLTVALTGAPGVEAQEREAPESAEATFAWDPSDPRIGLAPGQDDAGTAIRNMEHLINLPRAEAFAEGADAEGVGFGGYENTDLAFTTDHLFLGNYYGFQIFDLSDPERPEPVVSVVCPGGQGDVSVYGDLLFMSVEQTRGRVDCGTGGVQDTVSAERLRGVRIFDISDVAEPVQVKVVQTCRGSHTHTMVTDPADDSRVYVYVSGTGSVRPSEELPGCSALPPEEDPNTSLFRIEVIEVPLDAPAEARIVSMPRIFADRETGEIDGLWEGGAHGGETQETRETNQCHDITAYPALGLAAGACSGNGILLDISDPVNPVRVDEVVDPNFAYWHSATFNNDGTRVLFTDEWGGGGAPRCRATDPPEWGANAIFSVADGELELEGHYKLPVPQTELENCVAHNGSIVPVPGRDIMVQAWYQGGISVLDFTNPSAPFEIAFFDRGPVSGSEMVLSGYWSTYWFNGYVYGAEITRGLDVFRLTPSEHLSQNEIDAAELVVLDQFNAQLQPEVEWPAAYSVARAYLDQLGRSRGIRTERARQVRVALERAERAGSGEAMTALAELAGRLEEDARAAEQATIPGDPEKLRDLAGALRDLAEAGG